jgi:hypothetical protein
VAPALTRPPPLADMSASPMARAATGGQDIPTRRVVITDQEDMPSGEQALKDRARRPRGRGGEVALF